MPLLLGRTNCRGDVKRPVELFVKFAGQIIGELRCPGARVTAIFLERRIDRQILSLNDRYQYSAFFELLELLIVLDARQTCAIDLVILLQQRVARAAKLGSDGRTVVAYPAQMRTMAVRQMP